MPKLSNGTLDCSKKEGSYVVGSRCTYGCADGFSKDTSNEGYYYCAKGEWKLKGSVKCTEQRCLSRPFGFDSQVTYDFCSDAALKPGANSPFCTMKCKDSASKS